MTIQSRHPLKIALVGCGQIADAHLQELAKIPSARVVAVCDAYIDLARQAADRFGIQETYVDMHEMLDVAKPDVLHITTPAHTHARLALEAIGMGVHVYIEKPFTLDVNEAHEVIAESERQGVRVCVGHDQLFDPIWTEAKRLIERGVVGAVRHVESVLGYPISGQFGSQVTADKNHWVRRLPGGLFQNTISHPLYRIADLMADEHPAIGANWWYRGEFDFPTELIAHLRGESVTGTLTFHTQIAAQRVTRIYGTRGGLDVDFETQIIRRHGATALPGAFGKIEAGYRQWRESARNFRRSIGRFLRADIHYFAGMKNLFEQFYKSILSDAPVPITPNEIIRVTRWMDEIFQRCRDREIATTPQHSTDSSPTQRHKPVESLAGSSAAD